MNVVLEQVGVNDLHTKSMSETENILSHSFPVLQQIISDIM